MSHEKQYLLQRHKRFARLWRWRYLILIGYLAIVWSAIAALLHVPPSYEATAIISIKSGPLFTTAADKGADGPLEQIARPQITLLESETVIRRALTAVGSERMYPAKKAGGLSRFLPIEDGPLSVDDNAYINARKNLRIRQEPQTNIILVTFRHRDPRIATEFTDAVVRTFIHRFFEVYSNTGAASFFWDQKKKSEEGFLRASASLAEYSSSNSLFQIDEQRKLLLQRGSEVAAGLQLTRGSIVEKEGEVASIPGQLSQMKQPLSRSPSLSALLAPKGGADAATPGSAPSPSLAGVASDPPLLLVKVYQDTVASLVKTHTEIAGLKALEAHQEQSLKSIESELTTLSAREAEFERLQLEVVQSKANAEQFAKKAFEEQISQDLNERKFSPVQVLQEATMPLTPTWPRGCAPSPRNPAERCALPCLDWTAVRHDLHDDNAIVRPRGRSGAISRPRARSLFVGSVRHKPQRALRAAIYNRPRSTRQA